MIAGDTTNKVWDLVIEMKTCRHFVNLLLSLFYLLKNKTKQKMLPTVLQPRMPNSKQKYISLSS